MLALKWQDVDLDAGFAQVRSSHRKMKGQFVVNLPRTSRGRRKVALTSIALVALRQHRERQAVEQAEAGAAWQEHDLVFPDEIGERMNGITLYRHRFLPLLKRAGLPRIRFHDLRHTMATLLLLQGVHPKIVSEMLGHQQPMCDRS